MELLDPSQPALHGKAKHTPVKDQAASQAMPPAKRTTAAQQNAAAERVAPRSPRSLAASLGSTPLGPLPPIAAMMEVEAIAPAGPSMPAPPPRPAVAFPFAPLTVTPQTVMQPPRVAVAPPLPLAPPPAPLPSMPPHERAALHERAAMLDALHERAAMLDAEHAQAMTWLEQAPLRAAQEKAAAGIRRAVAMVQSGLDPVQFEVKELLEERLDAFVIQMARCYDEHVRDGRMILVPASQHRSFDGFIWRRSRLPDWYCRAQRELSGIPPHPLGLDAYDSDAYDSLE